MKLRGASYCFGVISRLALIALVAGIALAQESRGRVQGTVADPSQAAIANATVTLRNVNTGVETVRQADAAGHYLFDFVQPGTYSVAVQAAGFQRFVQENIPVLTAGDVTVNANLTVGSVAETVNVTEEVSSVQFNTSTMTTTVQGVMLDNLPVLARNPFTLALLNPAVVRPSQSVLHVVQRRVGYRRPHWWQERTAAGRHTPEHLRARLLQLAHGRSAGIDRAAKRHGFRVRVQCRRDTQPVAKVGCQRIPRNGVLFRPQSRPERPREPHYSRSEHRQDKHLWRRHRPSHHQEQTVQLLRLRKVEGYATVEHCRDHADRRREGRRLFARADAPGSASNDL
ncbi:MAG: hypothetical protein DMG58_11445 [Acidobacteria bacterium]|nr:MAG: hypothetical protein DMG58_11445 [Acidobacteriota bacterium]